VSKELISKAHPWMDEEDYEECLITLDVFQECVEKGVFLQFDGSGQYATITHCWQHTNIWKGKPPKEATHVLWFNK